MSFRINALTDIFSFATNESVLQMLTRTSCDAFYNNENTLDPTYSGTCAASVDKTTDAGLDNSDDSYATITLGTDAASTDGGWWRVKVDLDSSMSTANISEIDVKFEGKKSATQVTYYRCRFWDGSTWRAVTDDNSGTFSSTDKKITCSWTSSNDNLSKYIVGNSFYFLLRLNNGDTSNSIISIDFTNVTFVYLPFVQPVPTDPIIYSPYNGEINNTRKITFSSSSSNNSALTYQVYINNTLNITTSTNVTVWNGSDGYYELDVSATDSTGSSSNTTAYFTMDTLGASFSNNKTNATSATPKYLDVIQLNLTLTDSAGLSSYKLAHNGTGTFTNGTAKAISGTSYTMIENITISSLTRGNTFRWQVWANDSINNVNVSQSYTVTIQNTAPTLKTDLAFANWSAGHRFNATATFTDLDTASDFAYSNISFTSGDCDYSSNSTSGNDMTFKYNCSGTALASSTLQLNATDLGSAAINSSFKANIFPNQIPSMTSVELNKTSNVLSTDDLNCSAVGKADADTEDTPIYHYEWYNNTVSKGIDSAKLTSPNLTGLGTWYCEAWVTDSYQNSSKYSSSPVIVTAAGTSDAAPIVMDANATTTTTGILANTSNPVNNNSWINISIRINDANNASDKWTMFICTTPNFFDCQANASNEVMCKSANNQSSMNYSCRYDVSGMVGEYTRYAFALDNASLYSSAKSFTFDVNTPPEPPTLVAPTVNTYTNLDYIVINWTANDLSSDAINYTLYISNGTGFILAYNGTSKGINYTIPSDSTYSWRIFDQDHHNYGIHNITLGNFTRDTLNPNITTTSPSNSVSYESTSISLTINAKDTNLNLCNYTLSYLIGYTFYSKATANCQGTVVVTTPSYSDYILDVFAYDLAGNYNSTQLNFSTKAASPPPSGGGGASVVEPAQCTSDADCAKFGAKYVCIQNYCIYQEFQPACNHNGICEPDLGESFNNCGDILANETTIIEGDCHPFDLGDIGKLALSSQYFVYVIFWSIIILVIYLSQAKSDSFTRKSYANFRRYIRRRR